MNSFPRLKVALVGNPNAGKTSLFNNLTGLHQKVGNFPGVTVESISGICKLSPKAEAEIVDLPGTYSIHPKSLDEHVVFNSLIDDQSGINPDVIVVVVDETNLKRNLLLFTQIKDLGKPVILALNMGELAKKTGIDVQIDKFRKEVGVPVVSINARIGKGIDELKQAILNTKSLAFEATFKPERLFPDLIKEIKEITNVRNNYRAYQLAIQYRQTSFLSDEQKNKIEKLVLQYEFNTQDCQTQETIARYKYIDTLLEKSVKDASEGKVTLTKKLDKLITHKVFGYLIFIGILFIIFQAVFLLATPPMDWIDSGFGELGSWLNSILPKGALNDLIVNGIVPGIGGVVIFIPQIAILFFLISILEETGYMARVMFLMDKLMRRYGMNGRSVVPIVSSVACAVPAIMSTRTISSWKERIITIFSVPLMSCSARLPVYIILIQLVIPSNEYRYGVGLQGAVLMGLYVLGFLATLGTAAIIKLCISKKERSFFILELPDYRAPRWKSVLRIVFNKSKDFVIQAGKIIVIISIILWWLASHGPGDSMIQAETNILTAHQVTKDKASNKILNEIASKKLEMSYAGRFGKFIEPAIKPLGYDWKIGVALISSFAAREVFVSTMSTIYSLGNEGSDRALMKKMAAEVDPETGQPVFTLPVAFSLLIFYAFAMQCMSTLAIVKRETGSWKWPILQFIYMTGLAYGSSLLVFNLLS